MGSRGPGRMARMLAVAGVAALVSTAPGTAHAATEYDGDATALRIEGLNLTLFPHGFDGAPPELAPLVDALRELQSQAPEQLRRESLSLVMPDQVIGHAEFPGTDTGGAIPDNPLLTADILPARSVRLDNGSMLSRAGVSNLSVGGGVLSANLITTACTGDGETMSVDVSNLKLASNQDIVDTDVELKPGTAVPIAGIGSITFNQQDTDGSTYAEGTNVAIELDSDLSLEALLGLFDSTLPATRQALEQVLLQIGQTEFGPNKEKPLAEVFNQENIDKMPTGQMEEGAARLADEVRKGTRQFPEAAREALNHVAHLGGTVTVANAACSQATFTEAAAPQRAAPAQPVADASEPPLADTGSPAGMLGLGLAGVAALAGGGYALVRLRRRA